MKILSTFILRRELEVKIELFLSLKYIGIFILAVLLK